MQNIYSKDQFSLQKCRMFMSCELEHISSAINVCYASYRLIKATTLQGDLVWMKSYRDYLKFEDHFDEQIQFYSYQFPKMMQKSFSPSIPQNQKRRRSTLCHKNDLVEGRRFNSPNPSKNMTLREALYERKKQNRITSLQNFDSVAQEHDKYNLTSRYQQNSDKRNERTKETSFARNKNAFQSKQIPYVGSSTIMSVASTKRIPRIGKIEEGSVTSTSFKDQIIKNNNANNYKIIIYSQQKSKQQAKSFTKKQTGVSIDFGKKAKITSDPLIEVRQRPGEGGEDQEQAANTSLALQCKDLQQMKESAELVKMKVSSGRLRQQMLASKGSFLSKDTFRMSEKQLKESIELMKQSSAIQSFKGQTLRRCLSLEFQKKQERKMKLKDYLYLNEISGCRKKVLVSEDEQSNTRHQYRRVREFANDQMIESKIKQQICQNVRRLRQRMLLFEEITDFKGDKLLLYNMSQIKKSKMMTACDQIHKLINRYHQQLV